MSYAIEKRGAVFPMSLEALWGLDPNPERRRRGHVEYPPLTAEDRAAHARAVAADAELDSNPWVMHGYEPHEVRPLEPIGVWVYDETEAEWRERVS